MQKNNVMSLSDLKSILREPMKLAKLNQITDTEILEFLFNQGEPIALLSPDCGSFILTSNNCVFDISKILKKLVVGEQYIEKMQRA